MTGEGVDFATRLVYITHSNYDTGNRKEYVFCHPRAARRL
jgi:hypothetical protein